MKNGGDSDKTSEIDKTPTKPDEAPQNTPKRPKKKSTKKKTAQKKSVFSSIKPFAETNLKLQFSENAFFDLKKPDFEVLSWVDLLRVEVLGFCSG